MKMLFLFLSLFFFSNADTIINGTCTKDFYVLNNKIYYTDSLGNSYQTNYNELIINTASLNINKFTYDSNSNSCVSNMIDNNKYFLDSLLGLLVGFTILFNLIFLTIRVGSK